MDTVAEVRPGAHPRFREVCLTDKTKNLDRRDMPWLPAKEQATTVPLALVTTKEGKKFYFGDAVRGNLVDIAKKLTEDDNRIADKLFYVGVERLLGRGPTQKMNNCVSRHSIYYVGNDRGIRVYFMQLEKTDGIPVIIRIAACHSKGMEKNVYKEICSDSVKQSNARLFR